MKIKLNSVSIDDYDKALKFYTEMMGFEKKRDIPLGEGARWITVVSPLEPNGTELLLEPNASYPAMKALKESLVKDGMPFTAFEVDDIQKEYSRMKKLGVEFTMEPTNMGPTIVAVLDDTCGNLIDLIKSLGNATHEQSHSDDLDNLWSEDRDLQNEAFAYILKVTEKPVNWAYESWDSIVKNLGHKDNHNRATAAQVLCNLAKSDPKERILKDFKTLINVTKDERFVTARHCMQALWKVGVAGRKQQKIYMDGLETRFQKCIKEKNGTLIRFDILQSMRNVYDVLKDESIKTKALEWIQTEQDAKYQKKYMGLWKTK